MSRIDEVIVFQNLDKPAFEKIADLMLSEYVETLKEREITLEYDQNVLAWLAEKSFGGKSAARDLRNLIRKEVEEKIANTLIRNYDKSVKFLKFSVENEKLDLCVKG